MRQWFDSNPEFLLKEKTAVASEQPGLVLEIAPKGTRVNQTQILKQDHAICRGNYVLCGPDSDRHYEYSIVVITLSKHPVEMPVLYSDDPKLPAGILDRHIMSNGMACLGIGAEIKRKWRPENGLVGFFRDYVTPFLAWQVYYDEFGHAPPSGQRSHFAKGILEFYAEELGLSDTSCATDFMGLLAMPNRPKGHLACPCGSGKKLRDCHGGTIWRARETLKWKHVQEDLSQLEKGKAIALH